MSHSSEGVDLIQIQLPRTPYCRCLGPSCHEAGWMFLDSGEGFEYTKVVSINGKLGSQRDVDVDWLAGWLTSSASDLKPGCK